MEAQTILDTVRSGNVPSEWNVWSLRRDRVRRGMLGWIATAVLGFALFIPATLSTVPANFTRGSGAVVFTLLLLGILGLMAFGGLAFTLGDAWRLRHADQYLLVMTPDDFVLSTPRRLIHVPMAQIGFVTLRGVKSPQQRFAEEREDVYSSGRRITRSVGAVSFNRQPRTAPSLAFMDLRDHSEVVVATDDSFEDLTVLEQVLSGHVFASERRRPA
ncbi:MAG: hypothetical protein IVW57_09995 [Ktedonobacterales bacterium]|nr:hypothetical protein [Ktedonobacterales bacterium]